MRQESTTMALETEIPKLIATTAEKIGPSVVSIGRRHRGGGVVVDDGRILTNAHNIRGDEVTVTFADGRAERGPVAGVDIDGDLAVVTVPTGGAPAIAWSPDNATLGGLVLGVAAPAGGGTRVTLGYVSAIQRTFRGPGGRRIGGSIEHTAPLAPGSSGSPLVDAKGRLLGLNTNRIGEGFYLAIAADAALRTRIDALGRGEAPARRRLGVAVAPAHVARRLRRAVGLPPVDGLLVRDVEAGSLADAAGVREGDVLTAVAGRPIADPDDLLDALAELEPPFELTIVRGADEVTVTASQPSPRGDA
jgi:serine protease Do